MSVNRELNSMEKRRDTILDDDNENAIKLNDEDRNTITKNKSKDKLLKKTWVVCLLARVCEIKSVNRHSMISDGAVSS